MSSNRLRNTAD